MNGRNIYGYSLEKSSQQINGKKVAGWLYTSSGENFSDSNSSVECWFVVRQGKSTSFRLYHRHGLGGNFHSQNVEGKPHEIMAYIQGHDAFRGKLTEASDSLAVQKIEEGVNDRQRQKAYIRALNQELVSA